MSKWSESHKKRKTVICSRCREKKLNFGKGMCNSCLRRTKRETKPSFYLGTCYSEMKRRVTTHDNLRPRYFGMDICSSKEFKDHFINDKKFLKQYKVWQESGFQRKHAPSIDRIDNTRGYILDNLQFIAQSYNSKKDWQNSCYAQDSFNGIIHEFCSQKEMAKFLQTHPSTISVKLNSICNKKHKESFKGFYIWRD